MNSDVTAQEIQEIKDKIASGELSVEAPFDGMHDEWTPEAKQELTDVLGDVFGWDKSPNNPKSLPG